MEAGRYAFNRGSEDTPDLPYFFDVEAFESKLSEARRVKEETPTGAMRHLQEAVELYGGDFLEDILDSEWVLARQEELGRAYQDALLDLGGLLSAENRHDEAAEAYRRAIAHDPYSEAAHRGLMRCLAALGEQGRALRHHQDLAELLGGELGSLPAPETSALYESLRRAAIAPTSISKSLACSSPTDRRSTRLAKTNSTPPTPRMNAIGFVVQADGGNSIHGKNGPRRAGIQHDVLQGKLPATIEEEGGDVR